MSFKREGPIRVAAALILAVVIVGCDASSTFVFNSGADSYLEAALGTDEITKFGPYGSRSAWYDTLEKNEPRVLHVQGYQQLQDGTCTLSLWIHDPQEGKTYVVGPRGGGAHAIFTSASFPKNLLRSYNSSQADAGTLVLSRFDPYRRIVEGAFQFVVRNNAQFTKDPAAPESIRVMDGRFRLKFDVVRASSGIGFD